MGCVPVIISASCVKPVVSMKEAFDNKIQATNFL